MERLDCDRMFVAVLESGSFSKAAQALGTSSGQASKLVSKLEADLGVQLLNRTTRALSPTEVGYAYFERVKSLLEDFDALDASVRNASTAATGRLRLSVPVSFGTMQMTADLIEFARVYPDIQLDVSFADRLVSLIDEGFDVAVRIGNPSDSSLIARKLCDMRVVTAAAPAYLRQHGAPEDPATLAKRECIIDTNFREPSTWRFRAADGSSTIAVPVKGRLRFSNAEACLAAAAAGLGIARVPSFMAGPCFRTGTVRPLLQSFEDRSFGVYVVYPPGRHLALKVRVLVDFLASRYRGKPPWDKGWRD
jgi:DNA-binding transcriptional LysR family regulator